MAQVVNLSKKSTKLMKTQDKKMTSKGKPDEPEKLSKAGIWLRSNKPGVGEIVDMRAVLK